MQVLIQRSGEKRLNLSIDSEPVGQLSAKNTLSPYRAWRKNKTVKYKMSVCPLKLKTMLLIPNSGSDIKIMEMTSAVSQSSILRQPIQGKELNSLMNGPCYKLNLSCFNSLIRTVSVSLFRVSLSSILNQPQLNLHICKLKRWCFFFGWG